MKKIIHELTKHKNNNCIINLLINASENILLPLRENLKKSDQIKKRKDDLVTDADQLVEEYLTYELKKLLINSTVVGEESYSEMLKLKHF